MVVDGGLVRHARSPVDSPAVPEGAAILVTLPLNSLVDPKITSDLGVPACLRTRRSEQPSAEILVPGAQVRTDYPS